MKKIRVRLSDEEAEKMGLKVKPKDKDGRFARYSISNSESIGIKARKNKRNRYRLTEEEEAIILKRRASSEVCKLSSSDRNKIKSIFSNHSLSVDEKIDNVASCISTDRRGAEVAAISLGLSLENSQFYVAKNKKVRKSKRYIISSAQTASHVNKSFLNNMLAYAEFIDAEVSIIATRYKNPTSIWNKGGDSWHKDVLPYLTAKRQKLHKNLVLVADLKIQATSANPTGGIELFGEHSSCIVGSPRIEMKTVSTLPGADQKFIYSTGTVTVPSFTDTVAGGKAAEHHSYGFVVVEIDSSNEVHVRNVSAESNGSFNDLCYRVDKETVTESDEDRLMVWGDSHFAKKSIPVTSAFRSICKKLNVKKSVLHDIWDSESINVHNMKNPIKKHELEVSGKDCLQTELNQMFSELDWFEENMDETIVVASNHDDMLDRAMYMGDWRDNLKNARLFVEMLGITINGMAPDGLVPYYINKKYKNIKALGRNDSYVFKDIELGMHGDKGASGSRGSIGQFSRLSTKTVKGHTHSPSIKGGCYQVGVTCKLDHDYNKGLTDWAYASCLIHSSGKRQVLVLNKKNLKTSTLI